MHLREICDFAGWALLRDAAVASLGFVDIPLPGRLVFAANARNLSVAAAAGGVAAILTTEALVASVPSCIGLAVAAEPRRAFADAHNRLEEAGFYGPWVPTHIDPTASVHPSAEIDAVGVSIGPECRIEAHAIVLKGSELRRGVRVMPGAVLGSEGFQTMRFPDAVVDLAHAGRLVVGERCVLMPNSIVARAVFRQATTIGPDCRVGNGAFISHNCQIGARCLIGHKAVIAGNCRVGDNVTFGPGSTLVHGIDVGDAATVTAGAVVIRSIAAGQRVSGNFAVPHRQFLRRILQG